MTKAADLANLPNRLTPNYPKTALANLGLEHVWTTAAQVGNDLNISTLTAKCAITALTDTDIGFIDDVNDDLRTYRFSYFVGSGPHRPS